MIKLELLFLLSSYLFILFGGLITSNGITQKQNYNSNYENKKNKYL